MNKALHALGRPIAWGLVQLLTVIVWLLERWDQFADWALWRLRVDWDLNDSQVIIDHNGQHRILETWVHRYTHEVKPVVL
jgi:hypothetical protein